MKNLTAVVMAVILTFFFGCSVKMPSESAVTPLEQSGDKTQSSVLQPSVYDFTDYLEKNLPPEIYSNYQKTGENAVSIWCVDQSEAEEIVKRYGVNDIVVTYLNADYPRSVLKPVLDDVLKLPVMTKNAARLGPVEIMGGRVEININDLDSAPFLIWLETYEYKGYVYLKDSSGLVFNADTLLPQQPITPTEHQNTVPKTEYNPSDSLYSYLLNTLSVDDYGEISFNSNEIVVRIYCTNEENVRKVVEAYAGNDNYETIYLKAKYSISFLRPIYDDLAKLEQVEASIGGIPGIKHDGVHVFFGAGQTLDEFYEWLEDYTYKEFVVVEEWTVFPN